MVKELSKKTKNIGQVFTPQYIVEEMLDYSGYLNKNILQKHVIDNSCGDGAFLRIIVKRYCEEALKENISLDQLKNELEKYIHGIDLDKEAFAQCQENLNEIAKNYGIEHVKWDLYNQSSLSMHHFDGLMDFVVGNPPYVRVHNLDKSYDEVKTYKFANGGMTDLYLAFFELGFKMLTNKGVLCYITPSSWLNSVAAQNMRQYILKEKNLLALIDLGHFQAFENATAYTIISLFSKEKSDKIFDYYIFNGQNRQRELITKLDIDDCFIDGYFYLADLGGLKNLRDIKTSKSRKFVSVKNGFATLADKVFIGDDIPDSKITIRILKASTGKWSKCLFPYNEKGKLIPMEEVFSEKQVEQHFMSHKEALLKGNPEYPNWHQYGRTQAILDVFQDKLAINCLLRNEKDLKIVPVNKGEGVYSGLYIIRHVDIPFEDIEQLLRTETFTNYIHALKKYKSGGYYTFNTKDVEQYINWYLTYKHNKFYNDPSTFFGKDFSLV